jgi:hypothetical protein
MESSNNEPSLKDGNPTKSVILFHGADHLNSRIKPEFEHNRSTLANKNVSDNVVQHKTSLESDMVS